MSKITNFAHRVRPITPSFFTRFQSTLNLRGPRPIRRAPTIMVSSDYLSPVLLAPTFGPDTIPAPKGLEPYLKNPKVLALWGSLTAPSLSRNQVFQRIKDGSPLNSKLCCINFQWWTQNRLPLKAEDGYYSSRLMLS